MAGAATDLEYTQAELLADEGNKRSFDTRVVVHLVSSVVRFGDLVVVYASSHAGSRRRVNGQFSAAAAHCLTGRRTQKGEPVPAGIANGAIVSINNEFGRSVRP